MSIAFFDIDGTLLPKPSLEQRFFRELRWQGKIPVRNYFAWIAEAVRLGRNDFRAGTQANKAYLRGVSAEILAANCSVRRASWLPQFFPAAVQRTWWHALRGDSIVLVSGTIAPLAQIVKFALERELLWRGVDAEISVLATRLEITSARFTGRVVGDPMFAQEKSQAIKDFAESRGISLSRCSAYGDSSLDRWMLAAVGQPFAVNPTGQLKQVARLRNWQMLTWSQQSWPHPRIQMDADQRSPNTALKWSPWKRKGPALP
jgi:HAD superfamily hydrolase (TIGR01490 family)